MSPHLTLDLLSNHDSLLFRSYTEMADDGHDDAVVSAPPPPPAELPEIKLFGRWSCDDVQISDMSLQVCIS